MARTLWTFECYPEDGEQFEVEAVSRDVVLWEKSSKHTLKYLYDAMPMTELAKVAYLAAKRLELFDGTLSEWRESVDINLKKRDDDDEEEVDPTQPDR
jgi:hypothetical protein